MFFFIVLMSFSVFSSEESATVTDSSGKLLERRIDELLKVKMDELLERRIDELLEKKIDRILSLRVDHILFEKINILEVVRREVDRGVDRKVGDKLKMLQDEFYSVRSVDLNFLKIDITRLKKELSVVQSNILSLLASNCRFIDELRKSSEEHTKLGLRIEELEHAMPSPPIHRVATGILLSSASSHGLLRSTTGILRANENLRKNSPNDKDSSNDDE